MPQEIPARPVHSARESGGGKTPIFRTILEKEEAFSLGRERNYFQCGRP